MAIFSSDTIKGFSEVEKIRNMQLKIYNFELENISKMPEEERIDNMDKMRALLKLRELYEKLDIKVVNNEMILFKGKAVISEKELAEIYKIENECFKAEMNYTKLIGEEDFVLTDEIKQIVEKFIEDREEMLEAYITNSINAVVPNAVTNSTKLMREKEYVDLIQYISNVNIRLEGTKVYWNDKLIEKKKEYFAFKEQIVIINKKILHLEEKIAK